METAGPKNVTGIAWLDAFFAQQNDIAPDDVVKEGEKLPPLGDDPHIFFLDPDLQRMLTAIRRIIRVDNSVLEERKERISALDSRKEHRTEAEAFNVCIRLHNMRKRIMFDLFGAEMYSRHAELLSNKPCFEVRRGFAVVSADHRHDEDDPAEILFEMLKEALTPR